MTSVFMCKAKFNISENIKSLFSYRWAIFGQFMPNFSVYQSLYGPSSIYPAFWSTFLKYLWKSIMHHSVHMICPILIYVYLFSLRLGSFLIHLILECSFCNQHKLFLMNFIFAASILIRF